MKLIIDDGEESDKDIEYWITPLELAIIKLVADAIIENSIEDVFEKIRRLIR